MPGSWLDLDGDNTFDDGVEKRDRYNIGAAIEGAPAASAPKKADGTPAEGFRALVFSDQDLFADGDTLGRSGLPEPNGGPLVVDALCALATVATTFAFIQLVAAAALGPRPFTTASTMVVVAAFAAILAAGRLIPDQVGTLALWPFLFGLASPPLLLGLGYARALARGRGLNSQAGPRYR